MQEESRRICKCNIPKALEEDKMYEAVAAYVNAISPEDCVSDNEYEKRLKICDVCDGRMGPTCRFCGCFVLARAKRKTGKCPKPGDNKWET